MTPSTHASSPGFDSLARPAPARWRPSSRVIDVALVALVIACRLPSYLDHAAHWGADFDEFLHLFISGIHPFTRILNEVMTDAHPPLHYLLTRPFVGLGDSLLWPRLTSVIPAVVTITLFYACVRSLGLHQSLCFATTLLLAASDSFGNIAVVIRSYSLATMFLMATLLLYVQLLVEPRSWTRGRTRWILAMPLLAAWSLYASAFVVFCLGLTLLAYLLVNREYRRRFDGMRGAFFTVPEWAAVVAGTLALGWVFHSIRGNTTGHVAGHYRHAGESLFAFARRGLASDASYFTPFSFAPDVWLVLSFTAFVAASALLVVRYLRSRSPLLQARALIVLVGGELLALLFLLGAFSVYPFGGEMRHQFVFYPFFLLTIAFLLDAISRVLPGRLPRAVLFALVVAGTLTTTRGGIRSRFGPLERKAIWSVEFHELQSGSLEPLYLSQFHFICLCACAWNARWEHVRTVTDGCDLYRVEGNRFTRSVYRGSRMIETFGPPLDKIFFTRLGKVLQRTQIPFVWVIWSRFEEFGPYPDRANFVSPINNQFLRGIGLTVDQSVDLGESTLLRVRRSAESRAGETGMEDTSPPSGNK
jgi:hypothetical protein